MRKRPFCTICILFLVIQAARVLSAGAEETEFSALEKLASEEMRISLCGTVYRIEEKAEVTAFYLKDNAVSSAGGNMKESKVLVYYSRENHHQKIRIGNTLYIRGEAQLFDKARNPGNFDQRQYYRRQGIRVLVWAEEMTVRSADTDRLRQGLAELRDKWNRLLIRHLGDYYGGTMSAVLLGEKSGLDAGMKTMYQKCGISHLLAISGLHMTFLGMGIYNAMRRAGAGFMLSGIAGGILLILYSLMIGSGVSSLRALIMFLVRIGAEITGSDYDLPTSLGVSAAILCGWQPLYLTDAGFILSYGAILGIAMFAPVFTDMFGHAGHRPAVVKWMLDGMSTSLAVNLLLLGPLLWFYFEIPPYSVLLNLVVIPVMPVAMGAGIAGSVLALLWDAAGGVVLQACRAVLAGYDLVCMWSSSLPFSRFVSGKPSVWWLIVYYAVLGILYAVYTYLKRKEKTCRIPGVMALVFASVMLLICRCGYEQRTDVQITVLDVGQGDCIHIRGPSVDILVDGGSSDASDVGAYRISPYLLSCAADVLDYVFITHGDGDHISGIREMLEDQTFGVQIRNLVLPPVKYHDDTLRGLALLAARNGTRILTAEAGGMIGDGSLVLECLGPEKDAGLEAGNEASLVLEASSGGFRMLLTGDVEGEGEEKLIESGSLNRCDVLKAGHHGSKNSGSEKFLDLVQPAVTLISAGRGNRYGHPHEETLNRLEESGSRIYSTQDNGALTVRTDGQHIWISGTVSGTA